MKILVIQQKMIGDVLVSSIICNNLRNIYPFAQIDYLVYPFTVPVIENNPNVDNIILFKKEYRESKTAFFGFLTFIRKSKYNLVVDAYGKLESNLVVAFSGATIKIGFYKSYTNFIYTKTVREISKPRTDAGTAIENRLNLVKAVDSKLELLNKPKIFLHPSEIENGKQILIKNSIDFSKKIYMIGVLGSGENKTYPNRFMSEILDFIVEKTDGTLLFNYTQNQKLEAKSIFDLCQTKTQRNIKINIIPGSIREFLSLTYHCNALIGNEGGAVNMAKALSKPTFTIFSTWIIKEAWNSFENESDTIAVHLKDFKAELYGNKSPKEMKKQAIALYACFTPDLILPKLENFLKIN
jgi:heptosyltransferase-2